MDTFKRNLDDAVAVQRKQIEDLENMFAENKAAEEMLQPELVREQIANRDARKRFRHVQAKMQRQSLGSRDIEWLAIVVGTRRTKFQNNRITTSSAMDESDHQLEQQAKDVKEFGKSFDEEELKRQNMVLKNDFYETIRSIDELEVDILDLENVNALIVKETTENFQIANGIANELSNENTLLGSRCGDTRLHVEKMTVDVDEHRAEFQRIEQEANEISEKLVCLNDDE